METRRTCLTPLTPSYPYGVSLHLQQMLIQGKTPNVTASSSHGGSFACGGLCLDTVFTCFPEAKSRKPAVRRRPVFEDGAPWIRVPIVRSPNTPPTSHMVPAREAYTGP